MVSEPPINPVDHGILPIGIADPGGGGGMIPIIANAPPIRVADP